MTCIVVPVQYWEYEYGQIETELRRAQPQRNASTSLQLYVKCYLLIHLNTYMNSDNARVICLRWLHDSRTA